MLPLETISMPLKPSLAECDYHEQREYDKALSLYEEALKVGRADLEMRAEVASILIKMGNLYYERGDIHDAALERCQQGLEVEKAVLHDLHPNITVTLTNIGQIHKQRGDYTAALKLYVLSQPPSSRHTITRTGR
jgi:tetratricopeptide (TPR) repeat protein